MNQIATRFKKMDATEFNRIWAAVYGNPAWSVKNGHGSFLTLEFGQPALQIREPKAAAPGTSERNREHLSRRRVTVTGQWHLWIYCCNWSIALSAHEVAHSEASPETMAAAVERLDGQKLLSVEQGASPGSWRFAFDLGGELRTWPYGGDLADPSYEQWFLFERDSGRGLTVRADDQCSYDSSDRAPGDETWYPIRVRESRDDSRGETTRIPPGHDA